MLLKETGFTFNGEHSYNNYGLIYSEKDAGHAIIPQIRRNEYQIAGQSGSVLFAGEEYQVMSFSGTLYPHEEYETQADAQQLIRRVQAWLTAGRCPLIFDYEPTRYYMAQLSKQSAWSLKNWFGGEIGITFEAQPFAYDVMESEWTGTGSTSITLSPGMVTLQPAPAVIEITNTDAAQLTGVTVSLDSVQKIVFSGLTVAENGILRISSETPIGATVTASGSTQDVMAKCTKFSPITLSAGVHTVAIALTYGTGNKAASVKLKARGRY